jgi:hypothetical protein
LKQVGLAYRVWDRDRYPQAYDISYGGSKEWLTAGQLFFHFRTLSNELGTTQVLVCPADKQRFAAKSFDQGGNSNVSYFASFDAQDTSPQVFLSGDRNLALAGKPVGPGTFLLLPNSPLSWTRALHSYGNICLADGSVQTLNDARLRAAATAQGIATNRLVFP